MPCYYHSSGSFLIVSKKEFFGFYKEDSKACKKVKFPHVDIKENILIGFKGFTLGCETPTIKAKATLNGENLLVTLTISKKGDCKKNQEIVYWAQIPKNQFPEDLNLKKDLKLEIEENYN